MRFPRAARWTAGAAGLAGLACLARLTGPPIEATSWSREVFDRRERLLRLTLSSDDKYRLWVPLGRMSPALVEATLLQEDRLFRRHPGVNPYALARAFRATYLRRGRRIGGSTVTMQLARLRFRIDSRAPAGKLAQVLRALQLEGLYSKDRILEAYLNSIPYGGNIEGVGAASRIYFGKDVSRLTLPEALTLCVIPKSPSLRGPGAGGSVPPALLEARRRLFERWVSVHPEDREFRPLLDLPLALRRPADLPFLAPHFTDALLAQDTGRLPLRTTLDLPLQRIVERKTRAAVERGRRVGIRNAAVMLVDHRTMEVRALLGSADFFDASIEGQVNGARARRSPGSTLKPFIYGLAMDQGLIHPMSVLKDAPMSFGGFNPENFDREFSGPVHAWEALIRSRNLPAVHLAQQLEPPGLYGFLKSAGVAPLREESYYGLALALGGAELRMEDLVRLYAMLPNGGVLRPLRLRLDDPRPAGGQRLLSEESCFMVLDMLRRNPRPGQGFRADWTRDPLPVHWKTGTSYGFKDAWSIGVFGPYVLAVWVGDFAGESNPAYVGLEAAAPLMFEIIDAVRAHEPRLDSVPPRGLDRLSKVEVCSLSGQIPGPHCRHKETTWFIPGKSPIKACEIHREVLVDARTGRRACGAGLGVPGGPFAPGTAAQTSEISRSGPSRTYESRKFGTGSGRAPAVRAEVFEFWPSDLLRLFRQAGVPRRTPPPDDPRCPLDARAGRGVPPLITSPQPNVVYSVRASAPKEGTLAFSAVADADARQLFWFLNDRFVGKSRSGEPLFWTPRPGDFVVRVVDDQGRTDARDARITVVE